LIRKLFSRISKTNNRIHPFTRTTQCLKCFFFSVLFFFKSNGIKINVFVLQKRLIDICEEFVLLQYEKHMEIWRLGQTNDQVDIEEKRDGDYLPVMRSPRKFLHLKSKNDLQIVCSSLGVHPSSKKSNVLWLSYSDVNTIHIYKIELSSRQVLEPSIKVEKVKQLPLACGNRPALLMKFYSQYELNQLNLYYLNNKSCLNCLKFVNDESGFVLECSIQCIPQGKMCLSSNNSIR
jgi:hypothetical protein